MSDNIKKTSFLRAVRGEFKYLHIPDRRTVAKTTFLVMGASVVGGFLLGMFSACVSNLMTVIFF